MTEGIGPDLTAGAAPTITSPGAAAGVGTATGKPPEGYVPIAALQGEQANTTKERDANATLRAHMELAGFRFGERGEVVPPQPPQSQPGPRMSPRVQALAEQLGIDPGTLQGAIQDEMAHTAPAYVAPLAQQSFEQVKRSMAQEDKTYPIYAKTFEQEIERRANTLPLEIRELARVHPELIRDARASAIVAHLAEVTARQAELSREGTVVGRFTEGAASGTTGSTSTGLSPEAEAWARNQGVINPKVLEAAATNKADRERRTR